MTIVRRGSPFGELVSLRQAMDRLFEDSVVRPRPWGPTGEQVLPLDVTSTGEELVVEAALPGFRAEDVDITVEDGALTIRGDWKREQRDEDGETLVSEIRRGSVSRTMTLPTGLEPDKASASFEDGVLRLRIPRAEAVKPRQIRIAPTTDGSTTRSATAEPFEAGPSATDRSGA